MTLIVPDSAFLFFGLTYSESGASPFVNTPDGDSSYIQLKPDTAGLTARFHLPATTVCDDAPLILHIESRFVEGTGADGPGSPAAYVIGSTAGGIYLGGRSVSERFAGDESFTYVTDGIPQVQTASSTVSLHDLLAAGDLYVNVLYQRGDFDESALRVTYIALEAVCGTPPLRQNQRDDIRQGQRTSRQLTVRQVGYL